MSRDLDWSDVVADGERMRDEYYTDLWYDAIATSTPELERRRYYLTIEGRNDAPLFDATELRILDVTLLERLVRPRG